MPFWSRNGWIYFGSNRTGTQQIFRMRPDGSSVTQVTHDGANYAEVSQDGKWLYYAGTGKGIRRMPPEGGAATQVLAPAQLYLSLNFVLGSSGIYAIGAHTPDGYPAVFYPFDGGTPRNITNLGTFPQNFPAVSPDGKWFLYANADDPVYGIMLVDNFR